MLELKDCRILDIKTDNYFSSGCETCDYGSEYTREIDLVLDNGKTLEFRISQGYDYCDYSYGDLMKFILNGVEEFKTKTIYEFEDMLINSIRAKSEVSYMHLDIIVNWR